MWTWCERIVNTIVDIRCSHYYNYFAEKKCSWRAISVQMKAGLPPRVPSPASPGAPPKRKLATWLIISIHCLCIPRFVCNFFSCPFYATLVPCLNKRVSHINEKEACGERFLLCNCGFIALRMLALQLKYVLFIN